LPTKREVRPIKKGPPQIDYQQLKPRLKGKPNEQMKFCTKLLTELMISKKCKGLDFFNFCDGFSVLFGFTSP